MARLRFAPLIAIVAIVAACGGDDNSTETAGDDVRVVEVDMVDTAFEPNTLEITSGQSVRFVFTNTGAVPHDAFIGDADAQAVHETEMRETEERHGGGHGDESADALTVEPGDTAELTHTFDEPGTLEIGCHQPGHFDAGMVIALDVV